MEQLSNTFKLSKMQSDLDILEKEIKGLHFQVADIQQDIKDSVSN